jgi:hypothetical protein
MFSDTGKIKRRKKVRFQTRIAKKVLAEKKEKVRHTFCSCYKLKKKQFNILPACYMYIHSYLCCTSACNPIDEN